MGIIDNRAAQAQFRDLLEGHRKIVWGDEWELRLLNNPRSKTKSLDSRQERAGMTSKSRAR